MSVHVCDDLPTRGARGPAPLIDTTALVNAYIVHTRRHMSISQLADELYEQFGYSSANTCRRALRQGWRRLDLPMQDHRKRGWK